MQELKELLKNYPQVLVFNKNNYKSAPPGLLDFYQKTSMSGEQFDLTYARSPTFFDFIFCHSDDFLVFVGLNKKGTITGIASMIFRNGSINGALTRVCYLADLRLSFDRETLRIWRPLMGELLQNSLDINEIATNYFYTAVIDSNKKAQRALVGSKNNNFIYDELSSYQMINIHKPFPWKKKANSNYIYRKGTIKDLGLLNLFLTNTTSAFSYDYSDNLLDSRFKLWNNFSIENFYLCFEGEKLLGAFAPWSPNSKKNKVLKIPFTFKILKYFIKLPKVGENLEVLYLTHLTFQPELTQKNKNEIFKNLLSYFYQHEESIASYHMVSFCDFPQLDLSTSLKSQYICSSIPMKLFTVRHKNKPKITLEPCASYGFEMALV